MHVCLFLISKDSNSPKIRDRTRVSAESFGYSEELGKAVGNLGKNVVDAYSEYNKQKKAAEDVRLTNLENQYSAAIRETVHNPNNGLITRKGENAFGISDEGSKYFDKLETDLSKSLGDDLKNKFKEKVFSTRSAALLQLQGHEKNQYDKYQEVVFDMSGQNNIEDAIAGFNDDTIINSTIQKQFKSTLEYAQRNGLGEEWAKEKINNHTSKTHKAVITRMLNGNATGQAKSYYEKYKEQITGEEKIETEKLIKDGSLKGEAQAIADQVTRGTLSMEDALSKVNSINDPDLRDESKRRVKLAFSEVQDAKVFESNKALEEASLFVEQNKTVDAIPAQTWQKLDFKDRQSLYKLEAAYKKGENIETDMQVYNDLILMANNPKLKTEFLKTSMLKYQDKLAKPELKELIKLQADTKAGKKEAGQAAKQYH